MKVVVVLCLAATCYAVSVKQQRRFPDHFVFGTATASYQIEGAWDKDGKSENIWDYLTHTNPDAVADKSNGDIAADSYHNYKRDVEMMRELALDAYRFSISWSRVLPTGFANVINEAGIEFYNNIINEMLKYNIQPIVTVYHWDLPQKLQELGGWLNPLISDWFEDYARVLYENFGDRVKFWITINEPHQICFYGYGIGSLAPMLNESGIADYICAKHLVLANAKAYRAYVNDFKTVQGGKCGITTHVAAYTPLTNSKEDYFATEIKNQAEWAIYTDPIFSEDGGFPKEFSERVAEKSAKQGYARSRLPDFTEKEKEFVRGTADFFGLNHYTGSFISATEYLSTYPVPSLEDDAGVGVYIPEEWPVAESTWLREVPESVYNTLVHLRDRYNNPDIYITENGWSTSTGLTDDDRVKYYRAALENALDAIDAGVNLKGYMAWSLMDNFEWTQGYKERFGLYEVDFEDPARTRTPRKSAFVYKQIVKTRTIDYEYDPDPTTEQMSIDDGH